MSRTLTWVLIAAAAAVGLILVLRRRNEAVASADRPGAIEGGPGPGSDAPPKSLPTAPTSIMKTIDAGYTTGCKAAAAAKGVPSSLASIGCDPRANPVYYGNKLAVKGVIVGAKATGSAVKYVGKSVGGAIKSIF